MDFYKPKIAEAFKVALEQLGITRDIYVFDITGSAFGKVAENGILITYNEGRLINIKHTNLDNNESLAEKQYIRLVLEIIHSKLFLDEVNKFIGYKLVKSISISAQSSMVAYELNYDSVDVDKKIIEEIVDKINNFTL